MAPLQNPNPKMKSSNLNADAVPYIKLTPHFPPPQTLLVSYSPQYVYNNTYPLQMLHHNTHKQPFPAVSFHPQVLRYETGFYTAQEKPVAPKILRPFFPRYDVVDKDSGTDQKEKSSVKNTCGKTFSAPRNRSRTSFSRGKLEKQKSIAAKTTLDKKVISDHDSFPTSLMIRNIPNKFQRNDLLKILDNYCLKQNRVAKLRCDPCKSRYDFFYLPMDFKTGGNLGYAFVNFTHPLVASRFRDAFHKYKWEVPNNRKICDVSNAVIQGKDALRNHFRNSVFPCNTNDYLPVVFSPPRNGLNFPRFDLVGRRGNALTK